MDLDTKIEYLLTFRAIELAAQYRKAWVGQHRETPEAKWPEINVFIPAAVAQLKEARALVMAEFSKQA